MNDIAHSRILIVDDAPENIRILAESLKDKYIIMFALNGETALKLAKSATPPDIILLDVVMPGMNGYEVCRLLKQAPQTHDIPVIFVTGQSDMADEARGLHLGAVDYVSKPFRTSLLINRIANQLELKRHRDRLDVLVHERTSELILTQEVTITALATLAEWRDPETGGHIKRTQNYVRTLATHLHKFDARTLESLYLSAPLHDVGKVSTPDAVLLKPTALTHEEYEEIKLHTTRGRDALAAAERKLGRNSFLMLAREIAYGHHERWDGQGYPRGISGEEIPLPARIMSLADVYDALVSKRVYKPAMNHSAACTIIYEGRGTQFDPILVDAFVQVQDTFQKISQTYVDEDPQDLPH
ncbi:MAG: response regulator [Desulfovibrionaceae bacterium]